MVVSSRPAPAVPRPSTCSSCVKENYLRWDSLGEFLALAVSFEHLAQVTDNAGPRCWPTPSTAPPARSSTRTSRRRARVGSIDNRGSHFYLALFWAEELAAQSEDAELAADFAELARQLRAQEETINSELLAVQGNPADVGGYYRPDDAKASAVMRPSQTLNGLIDALLSRRTGPSPSTPGPARVRGCCALWREPHLGA